MERKIYTLCDTTHIPTHEEYMVYCRDMEAVLSEKPMEYDEWISYVQKCEYEDFEINMNYNNEAQCPVIITGNLGLWNGNVNIYPTRCENLWAAIEKCCRCADDMLVQCEKGVVYVTAYHHDGRNTFEIHKLSSRGIKVSEKWDNNTSPISTCKTYWTAKFKDCLI